MPQQISHIIRRIWHSTTQQVITVTGFGMLIALAADMLIAARLGTTWVADALILALSIPRLIEVVVREGVKFSLLAVFVEKKQLLTKEEYSEFVSGLLNLFLLAGIGLLFVGYFYKSWIIQLIGPGLSEEGRILTLNLFQLSLPLVIFALGSTILTVFLNSKRHFLVVSARNMAMPAVVVIALVIGWNNDALPSWIAAAHSLGYGLFFVTLIGYSLKRADFQYNWWCLAEWSVLRELGQVILYPTLGFTVRRSARVVENALATVVAPAGGVAAYYFAFRLVSAVQTVIGVSVATTSLPNMTEQVLDGDKGRFLQILWRQIKRVVWISLPISVIVIVFHQYIVKLLYSRGSFDSASILLTGQMFLILGFSITFVSLVPVLNSGLYANKRYSLTFANMLFAAMVNIVFAWWLSDMMGLGGIALSAVAASIASVVLLSVLNWRT